MNKESKKITVRLIFAWIFSILFIISGAGWLLDSVFGGILLILAGVIISPPFGKMLKEKANIELSGWLKVLIAVVLLVIATSLIVSEENQNKISGFQETEETQEMEEELTGEESTEEKTLEEEKEEQVIYQVGQSFLVDDISFKINKVTKKSVIGEYIMDTLLGVEADGVFYVIDITLENKAKESKNIFMEQFIIIDNQGRKFDYDTEGEIYHGNAIMFGKQLQPDLSTSGVKIFDLPTTAKDLKLEITCCGFMSETAQVDLGI